VRVGAIRPEKGLKGQPGKEESGCDETDTAEQGRAVAQGADGVDNMDGMDEGEEAVLVRTIS
jgi:hypothetical protein